jgi:hypothetical protein
VSEDTKSHMLKLNDSEVNFCQTSDGCQMQIPFTGKLRLF